MNKKKNSKTQKSKAARRRRKRKLELQKKFPRLEQSRSFCPENIEEAPTVLEAAHSFDVNDLGSNEQLGLLALSLAHYIASLRQRLFDGHTPMSNAFIQFGYSHLSLDQFMCKSELHANGGFNMPLVQIALLNERQSEEFVRSTEQAIRNIIAQLNERNNDLIRSVHLTIDETDKEIDPSASFGCVGGAAAVDYRVESEVNVAL